MNESIFAILLISIINLNTYMKKEDQQEIPKSIIKGNGSIAADLSAFKGRGKILFVDPRCVIVGIETEPFRIFITPGFNKENLPSSLRENIYDVKELILKPTFAIGMDDKITACQIPIWIKSFTKVGLLRLEFVSLDNLCYLSNLPIQYLIIENITYNNIEKLIADIRLFKHIEEISYDQSFPMELLPELKKTGLKLTLIEKVQ